MRQGAPPLPPADACRPELTVGAGPPLPHSGQAREPAAGSAPAVPTGKRSPCEPAPTNARAARSKNNGMHLVDWICGLPSSGEDPPSGEHSPRSFRMSSIKVHARTAAKPAPSGADHHCRDWFGGSRLEQAKGFEPSIPTSARVSVGRGKLRSVLGDDVAPMPATVPLPRRHARPGRAGVGATGSVPSVPAFRRHPPPPPSGSAPSIAFAAGTARIARNAGRPADRSWHPQRCRGRARAPPRPDEPGPARCSPTGPAAPTSNPAHFFVRQHRPWLSGRAGAAAQSPASPPTPGRRPAPRATASPRPARGCSASGRSP